MVQILGTGIQVKDILYLIIFAFFIYVLGVSLSSQDWNVPNTVFREFNNIFFNGIEVNNTCGDLFNGLFQQSNALDGSLGILAGIGNAIATVMGYLASVFLLLYRLLVNCGSGLLRLSIGWIVILYVLFKVMSFIRDARDLLSR